MLFSSDVVKAIKEAAFSNNSYPVILSLDNQSSIHTHEKMAKILSSEFGDMLYMDNDCDVLPSPDALKNKFIIKGNKLRNIAGIDRSISVFGPHSRRNSHSSLMDFDEEKEDQLRFDESIPVHRMDLISTPMAIARIGAQDGDSSIKFRRDRQDKKVHESLSKITFIGNLKMKYFYEPDPNYVSNSANCICSYSESETIAIVKKAKNEWIEHNKRHFRYIIAKH